MAFPRKETKLNDAHLVDEPLFTVARSAGALALLSLLGAFFFTPWASDDGGRDMAGVDRTVTGSIKAIKPVRRYTIRRSVLQKNPSTPCYIFQDGSREGDC